jgi:signal transduction histidine kinase
MRFFAEQYLGGKVTFTSSMDAGTTFSLVLPVG